MRFVVSLVFLLPLAACTSEPRATPSTRSTATVISTADPVVPTEVTCPGGRAPLDGDFDSPGHRTFTAFLAAWSESTGRPIVDIAHRRVFFVRDDGTAHTALTWMGAPGRGRIFPDHVQQCRDHAGWRDVDSPSTPVELTVGHCWVDPVEVHGRTWDVMREDQFGTGGRMPRALDGRRDIVDRSLITGELTVAGDVAI